MKAASQKNMLANFIGLFTRSRSFGIGVLDDNVEEARGGFSQAIVEDRRQSTRVEISVPVWFRVKNSWSKWLLGKSIDHSGTGIRLALPPGVKPGTEISLRMKLPDSEHPIDMKGLVVWVASGNERQSRDTVECGVAFKDIRNIPHKEKLIYLIANKLCKIGLKLTQNISAAPVKSVEELKECYSLVYRGYLPRRYCQPNKDRLHYYYYSLLPQSRTFTVKENNKLIGTVSVIIDTPCKLPMDSLFSRELDHLRTEGRTLAEVSLLAMAPGDKKKKLFSLTNFDKQVRLFRLFKMMYEYSYRAAGVTDLIIGVHPKHETLYKYIGFKAMASPKNYSGARGNPALPLHLDLVWAEKNWSTYLKTFFLSDWGPVENLRAGLPMNADLARQFLCGDPQRWENIPVESQKYLKSCYPDLGPLSHRSLFNFFGK